MLKKIVLILLLVVTVSSGIVFVDMNYTGLTIHENIEHSTNPVVEDTDGDGLSDEDEINKYDTDPNSVDTDRDGLDDYEEVNRYSTDPNLVDTDEDGLSDNSEIVTYNTNPLSGDTDGDGLDDYEEVRKYDTSPLRTDTSGDRIIDSYAVEKEYLNPRRYNITVEVDTDTETDFPDDLTQVQETFDQAPVTSEAGVDGINLTFIKDEKGIAPPEKPYDFIDKSHFNRRGTGVFHMYYTSEIPGQKVSGYTYESEDMMVIRNTGNEWYSESYLNSVVSHELGHKLGLLPSLYVGIDSNRKSMEEYNSVMNYNARYNKIGYSQSDSEFNDWDYIDRNLPRYQASVFKIPYE